MNHRTVRAFLCCVIAFWVFSATAEAREVRVVIDFQYESAREFSDGLAAVKSNDLWGYIDTTGKVTVPFAYKTPDVGPFSEGFAFTGHHFIDKQGAPAFEGQTFEQASFFSERLAAVQVNGQWGFIDLAGHFIIPPSYEGAGNFSAGMAPVRRNGLWGYIDARGRVLIGPRFLRAGDFSGDGDGEKLAPVEFDGKVGYIDRSGRFSIQPCYDEGGKFANSLAPVQGTQNRNDWGYIDTKGREVIPRQFNGAGVFENGLAPIATNARWGYIDIKGRITIDPLYDNARSFSEGLAAVERDRKWGYIRVQ